MGRSPQPPRPHQSNKPYTRVECPPELRRQLTALGEWRNSRNSVTPFRLTLHF